MKIYNSSGRHIKTVPVRYTELRNLSDFFSDLEHIRLSDQERTDIEVELFLRTIPEPIREYIGRQKPEMALRVSERGSTGEHAYYALKFGRTEVVCPPELYQMVNPKTNIKRLY